MLERSSGLSPASLLAIEELELRCISVDGRRLKLEWNTLKSRPADQVNDLLWWEDSVLVAFVGIYCFDGRNAELSGMVDPAFRRRGIATALLAEALQECSRRTYANVLLVVPRQAEASTSFARARAGTLDHSEHALRMISAPTGAVSDSKLYDQVNLRAANRDDLPAVARITGEAFGYPLGESGPVGTEDLERIRVIEQSGELVGSMRVGRIDDSGSVHGFAITPARQGQGIGRCALHRACSEMFADGVSSVGLEVATENEHALGLYTSLGFEPVTTEDYFTLTKLRS